MLTLMLMCFSSPVMIKQQESRRGTPSFSLLLDRLIGN